LLSLFIYILLQGLRRIYSYLKLVVKILKYLQILKDAMELITKIYQNKKSGQRLICIPKKYKKLKVGDYVEIKRLN